MSWLVDFLKSSVGRKFVMAITGLFLCFFLVVHLAGNLMLYIGADVYNDYAYKLHSNEEFLILAEVLLYAAFAMHIALAFVTTVDNAAARRKSYRTVESKRDDRLMPLSFAPDYTMMITGLVGLIFLVVHVWDFKFEYGWEELLDGRDAANKAGIIVADTTRVLIYILGSVALGIHVSHGLASACQTIGFNHPKYTNSIDTISRLFGVVVAVGFSSFPFLALVYPNIFKFTEVAAKVTH